MLNTTLHLRRLSKQMWLAGLLHAVKYKLLASSPQLPKGTRERWSSLEEQVSDPDKEPHSTHASSSLQQSGGQYQAPPSLQATLPSSSSLAIPTKPKLIAFVCLFVFPQTSSHTSLYLSPSYFKTNPHKELSLPLQL